MALSFSEKVNTRIGNRKYKVYEVTHDGSVTTIEASDIGLNYIDYMLCRSNTALSSVADNPRMSVTAGTFAALGAVASSATVDIIEVWGY